MKLYAFKSKKDGQYLAQIRLIKGNYPEFGLVNPKADTGRYDMLVISTVKQKSKFVLGAIGWIEWLKEEGLPKGYAKIAEDFPFDPNGLKVVTFEEK